MSFYYDANGSGGYSGSIPANGAETMFRLMQLLQVAGWVVTQSSDGSTYNPSGNQITVPGAGGGGMYNPLAWFVAVQPSGTRQVCFQISSDPDGVGDGPAYNWRITYSPTLGFAGGSPSNIVVPSAGDEIVWVGSGTDSAPTFQQIFAADGSYRMNAIAGDPSSNSAWMLFTNIIANTYAFTVLMLDVLQPATSVAGDPDPAVLYFNLESDGILTTDLTANGTVLSSYATSTVSSVYALTMIGNGQIFWPAGGGLNAFTAKNDFTPVTYGIPTVFGSPSGWKGASTLLSWNSSNGTYGQTFQVVNPADYIGLTGDSTETNGWVVVPWNGTSLVI